MTDRNIQTTVKISNSLLTKMDEVIKKFGFIDKSSFIRESIHVGIQFLEKKENYLKDPEKAKEFLESIEPRFNALKTKDAVLTIYKGLSENEQESIFYHIDQERKKKVLTKREEEKRKLHALRWGYELEPKVGFKQVNSNGHDLFAPILPDDPQWDDLTKNQKIVLLEKFSKNISNGKSKYPKNNFSYQERQIEEIVKAIKEEDENE